MEKIVQTAGKMQLGDFAPEFAHYNDDVLFGENWNNQDIDLKTRCIVTMVALMSSGITDSSLIYHLENAKAHGVTKAEAAAIITHAAFYAGWPKGWAVFGLAKDVWKDETAGEDAKAAHAAEMVFPVGKPNDGFAQYFTGRSFLAPLSTSQVGIFNVTFEPGCRNNWAEGHGGIGEAGGGAGESGIHGYRRGKTQTFADGLTTGRLLWERWNRRQRKGCCQDSRQ